MGRGVWVSVQSMEIWETTSVQTYSNRFLKALTEGACSSISQPSPKTATLFFGSGSHLGVRCRGAPLGHAEWEGGNTNSDQYQKGP